MQNPSNPQNQQQEIKIELSEEMAEGVYTNLAIVSHSNAEFFFDFIRLVPGFPKAKVKSRVVMSPQHAKYLLNALRENIKRYEAQYGNISEEQMPPAFPPGFTPTGRA